MKPPLPVIRGKDGIIRDANGRPVIVVFDSKPARSLCNNLVDDADQLQRMQNGPQPLEFISVSGAAKENTEARTLIRTHVMQDYKRRKLMQSARFCKTHEAQQHKNTAHVSSQEDCHPFWTPFPSQPSGSLDPFVSYPVQMQPYMHRLIHHYLTVITPAITEPGWKDFFPLATQDAAFFHAILLRSALHANFLTGNGKALEPVFHKIKAIQLVNEKLQNPTERLSDLMILTVAFLAITECNFADYTAWNLHMNGLSRIIEMRGGLKTLDKSLQYMIYR
ncbi:hypothetical protein F5884DRAFT_862619 [Xylogone sp. PMI_703]|nr:hypothetical protein F5884DRAFT_862619 [Xylogone sp. PMI_703]